MNVSRYPTLFIVTILLLFACREPSTGQKPRPEKTDVATSGTASVEDFEEGSKASYAPAIVRLRAGNWEFDGALIGNSEKDARSGSRSARIAGGGSIASLFDVSGGSVIQLRAGLFGNDPQGRIRVEWSTDGGSWQAAGEAAVSSRELGPVSVRLNAQGWVRLRISNPSESRINIDDLDLGNTTRAVQTPGIRTPEDPDNLLPGNPDGPATGKAKKDRFLLVKPQYALSYNETKGIANWVSWHLSRNSKGAAARCNCFESDPALPEQFFRVISSHYIGSGFDRGHLCPSEDRDRTAADNRETFRMTNIIPQAPELNQGPWKDLEEYCRDLIYRGKELYIIAGTYGKGGTGSKGFSTALAGGKITVPASCWKVIVVLDEGEDDLNRINGTTRIIAVDMPNRQGPHRRWTNYRTTVDAIEGATGYDLLSALPHNVQEVIEGRTDSVAAP